MLGLPSRAFTVENPWFSGVASVTTYQFEELLGTKLRALYQRKKGRDLFDLAVSLREHPNADHAKIVECLARYLAHDKLRITRAQFESNLTAKIEDPDFIGDVMPLLSSRGAGNFDALDAAREVQALLVNRLPGAPSRRPEKGQSR